LRRCSSRPEIKSKSVFLDLSQKVDLGLIYLDLNVLAGDTLDLRRRKKRHSFEPIREELSRQARKKEQQEHKHKRRREDKRKQSQLKLGRLSSGRNSGI
jgi:hypothetical protein